MRSWEALIDEMADHVAIMEDHGHACRDVKVAGHGDCLRQDVEELRKWRRAQYIEPTLFLVLAVASMISLFSGGNGLSVLGLTVSAFGMVASAEKLS